MIGALRHSTSFGQVPSRATPATPAPAGAGRPLPDGLRETRCSAVAGNVLRFYRPTRGPTWSGSTNSRERMVSNACAGRQGLSDPVGASTQGAHSVGRVLEVEGDLEKNSQRRRRPLRATGPHEHPCTPALPGLQGPNAVRPGNWVFLPLEIPRTATPTPMISRNSTPGFTARGRLRHAADKLPRVVRGGQLADDPGRSSTRSRDGAARCSGRPDFMRTPRSTAWVRTAGRSAPGVVSRASPPVRRPAPGRWAVPARLPAP